MAGGQRVALESRGGGWRAGAQLFALAGLAAQPLFDVVGGSPAFLVAHGGRPGDIALLALVASVGPAALAAVLSAAARAVSPRLAVWTLGLAVGLLVAVVVLPPLGRYLAGPSPAGAVLCLAAALGTGAAAAVLWLRGLWRLVPPALSVAVAVFFPAQFLVASPAASLLRGSAAHIVAPELRSPVPVVLLVFDALAVTALMDAAGQIDSVRYPAFAALADEATWYRRTSASADFTILALPAILDGRHPERHEPPTAVAHPGSLFTLLSGSHELRAMEPITALCPRQLCETGIEPAPGARRLALLADAGLLFLHVALPPSLADRLPPIEKRWRFGAGAAAIRGRRAGIYAGDRLADFERLLARIESTARPAFHFAHVLLPHEPYELFPSVRSYESGPRLPGKPGREAETPRERDRWLEEEAPVREAHRRYLLQLGAVDRLLGRLLARLRAQGLYDQSLLVVTSDHGVCFQPGLHHRSADAANAEEIASVPLFVKLPGQRRGRVDDRLAAVIDIAPTIAEALGAAIPWPVDGISLLGAPPAGSRARRLLSFRPRSRGAPLPQLVVPATDPIASRALRLQLERFGAGTRWPSLFAAGRLGSLVGRRVAEIAAESAARHAIRIDRPERYDRVAHRGARLPALVTGRIEGDGVGPDTAVAIAVAGTVRAAVAPYRRGGETLFAALLPEGALRPGRNDVRAWLVERRGEDHVRKIPPGQSPAPRPR